MRCSKVSDSGAGGACKRESQWRQAEAKVVAEFVLQCIMLLSKAAESSRTTQQSTVSLVVAWKLGIDVSISLCSSADKDVIFCW